MISTPAVYATVYMLFQIFFPYRLLQNIKYSSLCYILSPCWLSTLYIAVLQQSYLNGSF